MRHICLFSGIGGFAYAAQEVWGEEYENILFCDNDRFCQAVLRRHWPNSTIYGDIRELIAHTNNGHASRLLSHSEGGEQAKHRENEGTFIGNKISKGITLLTGGFPCQPFSHAGKRRSRSDNRYLWPEMLECIRLFSPTWVIAENVYGILSIEQGMVFEQICIDMENEGYEVWPFIIPACAVNAPHRRDRVWFVAHSIGRGCGRRMSERESGNDKQQIHTQKEKQTRNDLRSEISRCDRNDSDAYNTKCSRLERCSSESETEQRFDKQEWQRDWKEVAAATCIRGVDDGLPEGMDNVSQAKHRTERLKMLGNSIVPQVAMEIMRAIKMSESTSKRTSEVRE